MIITVAALPFKYCERNISSNNMVEILNLPHMKGDLNIVKIISYLHFKEYYKNDLKRQKERKNNQQQHNQKRSKIKKPREKEKCEPENK